MSDLSRAPLVELVAALEQRGVRLTLEDGRPKVRGWRKVSPSEQARLRDEAEELVKLLEADVEVIEPPAPKPPPPKPAIDPDADCSGLPLAKLCKVLHGRGALISVDLHGGVHIRGRGKVHPNERAVLEASWPELTALSGRGRALRSLRSGSAVALNRAGRVALARALADAGVPESEMTTGQVMAMREAFADRFGLRYDRTYYR